MLRLSSRAIACTLRQGASGAGGASCIYQRGRRWRVVSFASGARRRAGRTHHPRLATEARRGAFLGKAPGVSSGGCGRAVTSGVWHRRHWSALGSALRQAFGSWSRACRLFTAASQHKPRVTAAGGDFSNDARLRRDAAVQHCGAPARKRRCRGAVQVCRGFRAPLHVVCGGTGTRVEIAPWQWV